jgi:hypothetical protein
VLAVRFIRGVLRAAEAVGRAVPSLLLAACRSGFEEVACGDLLAKETALTAARAQAT